MSKSDLSRSPRVWAASGVAVVLALATIVLVFMPGRWGTTVAGDLAMLTAAAALLAVALRRREDNNRLR